MLDLITVKDELNYEDRIQYGGISFEDGDIGVSYYFSVEELEEYFLK